MLTNGPAVLPRIADFAQELTEIRRDIHSHPEIGFEEERTSALVAEKLAAWGIEVHRGVGKTGVVGVLKGKHPGNRRVGLRADMDALPMPEHTGLPYASQNPKAFHGCGHDGHTTILLGAARYLAETRDFAGEVVFVFQPAEEGLGGARAMLADGVLDRFPVDEIYGLHNAPFLDQFQVMVPTGTFMAGADFFDITITGKGSHGARPEDGRDPVVAGAAMVQALQSIVSRNLAPTDSAVLSVTKFNAGTAYNVIPGVAHLGGTSRFFSDGVRETIRTRIHEIAAGIGATHGVSVSVDIRDIFTVLVNHDEQSAVAADIAREVVGAEKVAYGPRLVLGSEDFADFLRAVPGCYFNLGIAPSVPVHNSEYLFDDEVLPVGATLFARIIETRLAAG